jgi:hypothetical protein
MNIIEIVQHGLEQFQTCTEVADAIHVRTHCIYPSNTSVVVSIRGANEKFVVMDDGRALREVESSCGNFDRSLRRYERIVSAQGLLLSNGVVKSPEITSDMLAATIILVANTSKELADTIFSSWRSTRKKDFKESVRILLRKNFTDLEMHESKLSGSSSKTHSFDNVIELPGNRRLIVDAVLRDTNSINSRVVAHMDVRAAKYENLAQCMVYDDGERWSSSDLSILRVSGVPIVAYSHAQEAVNNMTRAVA